MVTYVPDLWPWRTFLCRPFDKIVVNQTKWKEMKILKLCAAISALTILVFANMAAASELKIAVASNFTDATRELIPLFEHASGHTVKASFGSTGKLYSQIENGAPFEVFLAADAERPEKAEKEGLAVPGTRFTYAMGKLVLWSAQSGMFTDGEAFLKAGKFNKVALANPKTAPYGLAAEQVMEHVGLLETLRPKRVQGDNIAQTFQFASTGNADVGFVAFSQIKAWQGEAGSAWVIPQGYYQPIAQQAVLLKKGEENPAARAFLEFLKSPESYKVITGYGYGVN